jgi:hypothetical protein
MIAASGDSRSTEFGLQTCSQFARPFSNSHNGISFSTRNPERKGAQKEMANRKGVFIGAYVPNQLKEALQQRARAEHRTLSQEITRILEEAIKGKRLPPGFIDRRGENTGPRRRTTDPLPRRRDGDVPYIPSDRASGDD